MRGLRKEEQRCGTVYLSQQGTTTSVVFAICYPKLASAVLHLTCNNTHICGTRTRETPVFVS
ncbi:unnamed protein product [Ectocarpus sp. 8 AP-2014]